LDQLTRLKESLASAPVIFKGDYPYFIHPITDGVPRLDPVVLSAIIDLIDQRVDWSNIDIILGIEAMALPLCAPLAVRGQKPMVVGRKRQYHLEGEIKVDQKTGYSKGEIHLNDISHGERVLIVDDVISTGGTLDAVIKGVSECGASVEHVITVIEKGPGLEMLKNKHDVRFESLIKVEMDGKEIVFLE